MVYCALDLICIQQVQIKPWKLKEPYSVRRVTQDEFYSENNLRKYNLHCTCRFLIVIHTYNFYTLDPNALYKCSSK
jgi:hypothetical protein